MFGAALLGFPNGRFPCEMLGESLAVGEFGSAVGGVDGFISDNFSLILLPAQMQKTIAAIMIINAIIPPMSAFDFIFQIQFSIIDMVSLKIEKKCPQLTKKFI